MKALRKELWVSSGKYLWNCSGPMPNGLSSARIGAEDVAREAAVRAEIVALLEAGALLEQVGDDVDRQQRGDEASTATTTPVTVSSTIARALRRRARGQKVSASMKTAV